ncbi:hypothetical protein H257_14295 [Aphanomyces astaci]|uniref:Uncharacterized protein n=1 Tax=Aphanomyces astaci TaxID=112090 RepID=W4FRL5_APHAT|nr:hypothetical protein H257_14295 [Aphanomyces astaci]ETV70135.1 hypothetical protein H257_14295 [Aphanomyces astaci]|eukprot:XP_009840366.1 hypothetical protein H257_14295 [Aphanomyces astaci]
MDAIIVTRIHSTAKTAVSNWCRQWKPKQSPPSRLCDLKFYRHFVATSTESDSSVDYFDHNAINADKMVVSEEKSLPATPRAYLCRWLMLRIIACHSWR